MHASVARRKKLVVDWVPACDLENEMAKEVIIQSLDIVYQLFMFHLVLHLDLNAILAES